MTNLVPFPNSRLEKDEAGQWLARLDRGLTPAEHEALCEWLHEPRRRDTLLRLARDWDCMAVLENLAELFPLPRHENMPWRLAGKVAAMLLLATTVTAAVFYVHSRGRNSPPAQLAALQSDAPRDAAFTADYTTPIGQHRTVQLPDHSEIRLNTNTELHVEYSATTRLFTMTRGEAMFDVAKDRNRAFIVRVGGYDFRALGTAFNIRADAPGGLQLTVTQGYVRVHRTPPVELKTDPAHPARPTAFRDVTDVVVEANKAVSIDASSERIDKLSPDQVAAATAWQRGVLIFKATPLAQVVNELSRYSTIRFVISEPELANLPVSGYFEVGDIDTLSAALEQNVGIKIARHNGYLLLSTSQPAQ